MVYIICNCGNQIYFANFYYYYTNYLPSVLPDLSSASQFQLLFSAVGPPYLLSLLQQQPVPTNRRLKHCENNQRKPSHFWCYYHNLWFLLGTGQILQPVGGAVGVTSHEFCSCVYECVVHGPDPHAGRGESGQIPIWILCCILSSRALNEVGRCEHNWTFPACACMLEVLNVVHSTPETPFFKRKKMGQP